MNESNDNKTDCINMNTRLSEEKNFTEPTEVREPTESILIEPTNHREQKNNRRRKRKLESTNNRVSTEDDILKNEENDDAKRRRGSTDNELQSIRISTTENETLNIVKEETIEQQERNAGRNNNSGEVAKKDEDTRTGNEDGSAERKEDQENQELILILRVQPPHGSPNRSRSRNIRRGLRTRRRQRIDGQQPQPNPEPEAEQPDGETSEGPVEERGVEEVHYEFLTADSVWRKMSTTWRNIPKYKLTASETIQQEADLFHSFLKETKHEGIEQAGPEDRKCCICYENKATRIIIPCSHFCLCYNCARSIAFSRSTLAFQRIPKKCPLCQAAISKMISPL